MPNIYYHDYLQLHKILDSQEPESAKHGVHAHDEMLFIIIHQAYELWFKQVIYELDAILKVLGQEKIDDGKGDLGLMLRRMNRVLEIWKLLTNQIDVLETMTSQDFLEFRNFLTPASGFQSVQFKLIEAKMGLEMEHRHGGEYYKRQNPNEGGFDSKDYHTITTAEGEPTMKKLLVKWLERMPFWIQDYWTEEQNTSSFWDNYTQLFLGSLNEKENKETRLAEFESVFFKEGIGSFSPTSLRSALFIMLYRDYPLFHLPFQLLTKLQEIDETMSVFRYRHLMMVTRMIGMRVGTGGINKQGKNQEGYLEGAMRRHTIFREVSELATFLIERRNLPNIPVNLVKDLSFRFQ
jgi:tryptophan 2,3-dioxygenase